MAALTETVVIVTGGWPGAGRELSFAVAGRGHAVVVVYLDDQNGADATVDEIVRRNGTAIAVRADLTDELDVDRLFRETVAAFGGVDAIVHAAPLLSRVVNDRAMGQLRDGGLIVNVGRSGAETPFLINELRARGIRVAGPPRAHSAPTPEAVGAESSAPEPPAPYPDLDDISYCVAILDQWRLGELGRQ